ncbi:uncharacterized protein C8Q71DRAFT_153400 [Rhodofomes roseus]|uniref:Uncharacterized protein n=1 Tax=Rhodofomes roseus TaxID=34475 RepID=A0ABQ8KB95_9APHY|nr:uncharacterized protein C8Q71DRAFT_153400 [Rhodofomes roseus]KAH9834657.1 hypothetical protein C8Q71DRAFT_153400 [Rhodofomes roseus]
MGVRGGTARQLEGMCGRRRLSVTLLSVAWGWGSDAEVIEKGEMETAVGGGADGTQADTGDDSTQQGPSPQPALTPGLSPTQKISSLAFVVVCAETPATDPPAGVDTNAAEWEELPVPTTVTGAGRTPRKSTSGRSEHICGSSRQRRTTRTSGSSLRRRVSAAGGAPVAQKFVDQRLERNATDTTGASGACASACSGRSTRSPSAPSATVSPPDLSEPQLESPVVRVRRVVGLGSWAVAKARRAGEREGARAYAAAPRVNGVTGDVDVEEALRIGASLKRALDEGSVAQARDAVKHRHLDPGQAIPGRLDGRRSTVFWVCAVGCLRRTAVAFAPYARPRR